MGIKVTSEPASEPVTTAEAKAYARVDISDDDTLFAELIKAARRYCERWLRRKFITTTVALKLDAFPSWEILLPYPPLIAVSTIGYTDTNDDAQTLSSSLYVVDTYSEPGRITPASGEVWPQTWDELDSVTITYTAGYGASASAVPEEIKIAIKLLVNNFYERRMPEADAATMRAAQDILDPLRYGEYFSCTLAAEDA